jgi:hypothetical protein
MIHIKDKSKKREFLDRLIYAKQFKGDDYKLIFHVVNTCYKLVDGNRNKFSKIISWYSSAGQDMQVYLSEVLSEYDPEFFDMFRYNCFTQIEEVLTPEDRYFIKSGKKRLVTLREYKFLLQRITKHVFKSKDCKSVMVNNYFLGSGLEEDYKKKTAKGLCRNKLAHILQVLQKHQYLHITYNHKNQRVVQIGPHNPFYLIDSVPDVEEQEVSTLTDRKVLELISENELLKSTISLLQEEFEEARVKIDMLDRQVESLQGEKDLWVEMLTERDEEIKQLTVVHDYEVEGSWITYNLDGYGPVKLSLN